MKTAELFAIDAQDFERRIMEYAMSMPGATENAVMDALVQLREDAEKISPTVPLDMGDLRQDVEVEVKRTADGAADGYIAYQQPYATRMHEEAYENYSEPGSGAKYVESKLSSRAANHQKIPGHVFPMVKHGRKNQRGNRGMIKEITKLISTKCSLTVGTNLYAGYRPTDAPDECDVVTTIGGGSTVYSRPDCVNQNVQIISRAKSYPAAERRAYAIFDILRRIMGGVTMPVVDALETKMVCNVIEPINPPQSIGTDDQGRFLFSTNYVFRLSNQGE